MSEPAILARAEREGHVVFRRGSYNLNIIGVRTTGREANKFDDWLHVVFKDDAGCWIDHCFRITTDAGNYWLHNPMKVSGTAILVAGQYRGAYKLGKHRGKYTALVQRGAAVKIYRDNNRDSILDHDPDSIREGWFGINIHRANPSRESTRVEKYSAGCQVFADPEEFDIFIALCEKSATIYGDTFTYTLLED